MNRRVYIGGISGVGKTTLMNVFCREHESFFGCSSSSFLTKRKSSEFFHYFDSLSFVERAAIRHHASGKAHRLLISSPYDFMIDGHFSAFNRITGQPEVCFNDVDAATYTHLILLDATPNFILYLRQRDTCRKSYSGRTYRDIKEQLAVERKTAMFISKRYNLRLTVIDMPDLDTRLRKLNREVCRGLTATLRFQF